MIVWVRYSGCSKCETAENTRPMEAVTPLRSGSKGLIIQIEVKKC